MNAPTKKAAEYARWSSVLHFGHLSLPDFKLDHGIGTQGFLQPPFQELMEGECGVVQMEQVHGNSVRWVDACPFQPVSQTDGLAADQELMALVVETADCVPVLLFDPRVRIIATLHIGWRGLSKGVVANVFTLLSQHASQPQDVLVGIGPAICQACYEIGPDVKQALPEAVTMLQKEDKWTIDLQKEVLHQCELQGVDLQKVEILRLCTKEHQEQFPSYRRDQTNQRFYSYIRLKPLA